MSYKNDYIKRGSFKVYHVYYARQIRRESYIANFHGHFKAVENQHELPCHTYLKGVGLQRALDDGQIEHRWYKPV